MKLSFIPSTHGVLRYAFVLLVLCPCHSVRTEEKPSAIEVSLIQLIATPERFDGKRVIVIGVYKLDFESFALYLNEADAKHFIQANSVALGVFKIGFNNTKSKDEWDKLNNSYVRVVGTFRHAPSGHMNLWASELTGISSITPIAK